MMHFCDIAGFRYVKIVTQDSLTAHVTSGINYKQAYNHWETLEVVVLLILWTYH